MVTVITRETLAFVLRSSPETGFGGIWSREPGQGEGFWQVVRHEGRCRLTLMALTTVHFQGQDVEIGP